MAQNSSTSIAARPLTRAADSLAKLAERLSARIEAQSFVAVADGERLTIFKVARSGTLSPHVPNRVGATREAMTGELRLPDEILLKKRLKFPADAMDVLEPVLDSRLDRLTPWSAERVIYGYAAKAEGAEVVVDFVAAARDVAEHWVSRAKALGFTPTALGGAAEAPDRAIAIDLWRGARNPARQRAKRHLAMAGIVVSAALAAGAVASYWAATSAEQRLAALDQRAASARAALGLPKSDDRDAALIAAKRPEALVVVLIDRISKALPDGSVLRELEITPAEIRLVGDTDAAPELIGLLRAADAVGDVRFAAPVTRNADGRDGFEILGARAGLTGEGDGS